MARTPARIALLALALVAAHAAPAAAGQTTLEPSPLEARTFSTTNGGWSSAVDYNGLVCIPGVTCPSANPTHQTTGGAGGAGDGYLRDNFGTLLGVLTRTTILWTSPSFVAPSEVDVARLTLMVRPQIASLNAIGVTTIAPRLIDVADGTRSRALAPTTLTTASSSFQPMSFDVPAGWVVPGRTYRLAIDVSFTNSVSAVTSGNVDLDNVALSLATLDLPTGLSGSVPATGALRATGAVDPMGSDTAVTVEYGPTAAYGSATAATTIPGSASGSQPFAVAIPTAGLTAGGTYHYRVKAENADGAVTTADDTFVAPTPPSSAAPTVDGAARVRARTVTFARAADVTDAAVELLDGDDALISSHPDGDGDGSVALTLPDADGSYRVRVRRTTDRALTSTSSSVDTLLDRVGPATGGLALAVTPAVSSDAQRTVSFTRPSDAATVTAQVIDAADAAVGAPLTVAGASETVALGAADGDYRVRLTLTDASGNESTATSTAVTLDTVAPAAGPAPTVTGAGNVRVRSVAFTRDPSATAVRVELLDAADVQLDTVDVPAGATTALTLPDADGGYGVRVRQTDAVGNSATSPVAPVTLDRAAPDLSALALSVTPALSSETQRTVSFTRPSDAATVTAQVIDGGDATVGAPVAVAGSSETVALGAADGGYRVVLSAADAAGNVARATSAVVTLDTVAPAAGPAPATGQDPDALVVDFTRAPDAVTVVVEVRDADGAVVLSVPVPSGSRATVRLPAAAGAYSIRVVQTDAAGNSEVTAATTVRRAAPSVVPDPRGPPAVPRGPVDDPRATPEQCTAPALALTGVTLRSGRVHVRGWAAAGPGAPVTIVDLRGKQLATATAGAGGVFAATVRAPRTAAERNALGLRATAGSARSYAVMLRRANALTTVARAGTTVTLRGRVELERVGNVTAVEAFGGSGSCPQTDAAFASIGSAAVDRRTGAYTLRVTAPASGRLLVRTRVTGSRVVSRSAYVVR